MEKNLTIFISSKNQTLLWEIINQSILFNKLPKNERAVWFKNIIGYIYYEKKTFLFDTDELVTLNKKAIYFMLNELKNVNNYSDHKEIIDEFKTPPTDLLPVQPSYDTPYFTNVPITEEYQNKTIIKKELYNENATLFDIKQKEFNELIANNTPPQIDFRIKEIDEPLEDLNILIERCVKERNAFIEQSYGGGVVEP